MTDRYFEYDVGLSFAGEQREYVEQVADELKSRGIRVFYDDYEKGTLWGKDLYAHLSEIYEYMCRYCVIFVSEEYAGKVWPNHERQSAQSRALAEKHEYILPARFDDTDIPGLLDTVGYIDLNKTSPFQLCDLISEKVGDEQRKIYLPPTLDRLYERLGIGEDYDAQREAQFHASSFFSVLPRMTADERNAVFNLIRFSCPADLPENVHIDADLLRRYTNKSVSSLKRLLGDVRSLGFECSLLQDTEDHHSMPGETLGDAYLFYLTWYNSGIGSEGWMSRNASRIPALMVACEMIKVATENYCEEHGAGFLERLDFSQLASATASKENDE